MLAPTKDNISDKKVEETHIAKAEAQPITSAEIVDDFIKLKRTKYKAYKQNSFLFFSVGLAFSIAVVVTAFEWKSHDKPELVELNDEAAVIDELIDIPPTEQPPPAPPQVLQQPNFTVVEEEEILEELDINFDVEITEETVIEAPKIEILGEPEEEEVEEIFTIVEQQPAPHGGMQEFLKFISSNINYPPSARRINVEGRVFVQFVVAQDGTLTDFEVIRGIGAGCDEEAIRVLKLSPKWKPGKQRGKPVKVRMILPIMFMLQD